MATYKSWSAEEEYISVFNPTGGTPAGATSGIAVCPIKGYVTRVGVSFSSSVNSAATFAVRVWNSSGSTAAMASTALGTADLPLGVAAIFDLTTSVAVVEGDGVQFVTSGGPTSAASSTAFAVIKPLPFYST